MNFRWNMSTLSMEVDGNDDCQNVLSELRTFIAGASRPSDVNHENLVKTAVSLLKSLPAAREAVLEYFGIIFHNYVSKYLTLLENETCTLANLSESEALAEEESPLLEIKDVLCHFVKHNSEAWAPIVSTWSLALLGDISSRYVNHNQVRPSLNERLQLWTACGATRSLLDINTQCMSRLMHLNTEACINALLDMSVLHNPHFDWVVVHVGSSFPETVVSKVLICGLKDFCINEQATQMPKLNSVVGILGHLAGTHFAEIKNALVTLFQWSLEKGNVDKSTAMQKVATVPYLLHLASMSTMFLKALSADTLHSLNMNVLMRLSVLASDWWCYFSSGRQDLLDMVVQLLLRLENGIYHILTLLFETASSQQPEVISVALNAQEIVELFLSKLDMFLRTSESTPPLVRSFYAYMPQLKLWLLSDNALKASYATRIFILLGNYNTQLLSICVAFLLNKANCNDHVERLIELTSGLNDIQFFSYAFRLALQFESLENVNQEESSTRSLNLWKNIQTLLSYEICNNITIKPVYRGLTNNFSKIFESLKKYHCHVDSARIIASIIHTLFNEKQQQISIEETLSLTEAIVLFFYSCLVGDSDNTILLKDCQLVNKVLIQCCTRRPVARNQAVKMLIETALHPPASPIFGATIKPDPDSMSANDISLLKENIKQGNTLMVAQSAMSVFHTGIIGSGLRETYIRARFSDERIKLNTQNLMNAIYSCCLQSPNGVFLDSVINIALSLVQLISPDVMFNGLPWPEEEFCKVTVERDLCIRRAFDSTPLLWTLLKFVAAHRPALCYCSVLLRAITATLIAQWSSASQGRSLHPDVQLVQTSVTLFEILAMGQLLPPPLSGVRDIVPHLQPQHVLLILRECVWNYMRDHVPSPALFSKDPNGVMWRDPSLSKPTKQYTETLRLVMLSNIDKLGHLYYQLFTVANTEND